MPEVLFCVPLVARAATRDWALVRRNLDRTLASLMRQTDPRWRAVVCGQDLPPLPSDPRVRGLRLDRPWTGAEDKWLKMTAILEAVSDWPGLLFPLDADDVLHPGLVATLAGGDAAGWLVVEGYSVDATDGTIGRHAAFSDAAPRPMPFWVVCGSCAALPRLGDVTETREMLLRHGRIPGVAAALGIDLRPVPYPAALYLVGHGENLETRAGREAEKRRYIAEHRLPEVEAAEVRRSFALPPGPLTAPSRPPGGA